MKMTAAMMPIVIFFFLFILILSMSHYMVTFVLHNLRSGPGHYHSESRHEGFLETPGDLSYTDSIGIRVFVAAGACLLEGEGSYTPRLGRTFLSLWRQSMDITRGLLVIVPAGFLLTIVSIATAKYSGGSGTADDPYQIATGADLITLGESPLDCYRHFILTTDINMDPKLPGGGSLVGRLSVFSAGSLMAAATLSRI